MKLISTLPFALYRLQNTKTPKFREKALQFSQNRQSFDFQLGANRLYNPINNEEYNRPNGLSMRPLGVNLLKYLQNFNGKFIYELPKDLVIPKEFNLYHQHNDHYSFQTAQPIQPEQFCKRVTLFLQQQKIITKKELLEKLHSFQKNFKRQ